MKSFLMTTAALLLLTTPAAGESHDVAAAPPLQPQMQSGVTFLTGGIGQGERDRLRGLDDDYNVRVALTQADGAYLADIRVAIEDANGTSLVETTTRGPIFLAELAPGRYVLRASKQGRTTERRVIDVPKDRDQVRLYVALVDSSRSARPE
jgi:hypothetical protein